VYISTSIYFSKLAPPGRETTFQGILNGVWGVGSGIGSLVCGWVNQQYGAIVTFRTCGFTVLGSLIIYITIQFIFPPPKDVSVVVLNHNEEDVGEFVKMSDFSIDDVDEKEVNGGGDVHTKTAIKL